METMEAWQYPKFQGKLEDALAINRAVPRPNADSLAAGEIVVQVISASINPVDYKIPESGFIGSIMIPRPATPGLDFCGRVFAKHPSVTAFDVGQLVFGGYSKSSANGSLAQFIVISQQNIALLPKGIDPHQGAAVGTAATTAYQSLMPESLKQGAQIFINGGSGGVGSWSIQFAKVLGARVTTSCSTGNISYCRQLGADEVLDYKQVDIISALKDRSETFDLVIDNVGNNPNLYNMSDTILRPNGAFVQVGVGEAMTLSGSLAMVAKQLRPSFLSTRRYYFVNMKNSDSFFQRIATWMGEGKVKAVVDEAYAWDRVPEAFDKLRKGHVRGKIVVHVAGDNRQSIA